MGFEARLSLDLILKQHFFQTFLRKVLYSMQHILTWELKEILLQKICICGKTVKETFCFKERLSLNQLQFGLKSTLFNKPFGFKARLFLSNFVFKARILVVLVSKQASACILEFSQCFFQNKFLEPTVSIKRIMI